MASSKQMRELARNPSAWMKFQATGELPREVRPMGPLIEVLRSMTPRERIAVVGLTVDSKLGYSGSRMFHTAEQALRWCAPSERMLARESWPAESWRDKRFTKRLSVADVLGNATNYPDSLADRFGVASKVRGEG